MRTVNETPSDPALWRRISVRYEWLVERIVPCAGEFFETCIRYVPGGPVYILELGSGTGYATERILRQNKKAHIVCLDLSEDMMACARTKPSLQTVQFVLGDIRRPWPEGRLDVVFSTLCLHHLTPMERRKVIRKARGRLSANGLFINGDIFKPEERYQENFLRQRWFDEMQNNGLSVSEASEMLAKRRDNFKCFDTFDRCRTTLKTAGFSDVVCAWQREMAAIWVARK